MYAVVAGQTSVKAPEKAAFENYLSEDVYIVSCHSLHGPTVSSWSTFGEAFNVRNIII
jgi:prephenate dehydrogenase (NADP+)